MRCFVNLYLLVIVSFVCSVPLSPPCAKCDDYSAELSEDCYENEDSESLQPMSDKSLVYDVENCINASSIDLK